MPIKELHSLSDDARVWIFGASPSFSDPASVLRRVDSFLESWAGHGIPILTGREIRENRFLIIAAEKDAETSGCSIDKLFGLIRDLERSEGVSLLDAQRVFYRDTNGAIVDSTRREFSDRASAGTRVFDLTVPALGDLRRGSFETTAGHSWHAALLSAVSA